ncbi:carboxypeptidase-like regulatory domain-containing protein [Maribacter sp.]
MNPKEMKKYVFTLWAVLACLMLSCTNDDNANTIKISGVVVSNNGIPEANVTVSISDFQNLTTTTDSEGFFQIEGVAKGEHELKIYKKESETDADVFLQRTFKVLLNDNTKVEGLTLPNPVVLATPTEITSSSALIPWNTSVSDSFREYKLYRHNSSGLEETTGTLVHVATDIDEATFLDDDLNNSETYYYRVFVLDEFGQIGGSNIISLETESIQLIKNGGFEEVDNGDPLEWTLIPNDSGNPENAIEIDNSQATEGANSLKFHNADVIPVTNNGSSTPLITTL